MLSGRNGRAPVVEFGKDLVERRHVALVVVHVFRQQGDARGVLPGEPLCHQPIPVQIAGEPLDFLVPRLQAAAAEKRSEQLQRAGFCLDLGLKRLQPPGQHISVDLPVEAVLAFLQARPAGLQSLQEQQALAIGIGIDPVAVLLALTIQQAELLVVEQRRARKPHALRQLRNVEHRCPADPRKTAAIDEIVNCEAVDESSGGSAHASKKGHGRWVSQGGP